MTSSWQTLIYRIIINKKKLCFFCIENHIRLFYILMGTQHACGHHEAIKMFSYVAMWQCQKLCVGGNSLHCIFKPREGTTINTKKLNPSHGHIFMVDHPGRAPVLSHTDDFGIVILYVLVTYSQKSATE